MKKKNILAEENLQHSKMQEMTEGVRQNKVKITSNMNT